MDYADEDGNGFIDLFEFKKFVASIDKKKTISAYLTVSIFKQMDDDMNGQLDLEEFGHALWLLLKQTRSDLVVDDEEEE